MPRAKPKPKTDTPEEMWTVVQVAACLTLSYQVARNRMLEGRYGDPAYDAKTRKLTVPASRVLAVKSRRGRKAKTHRRRS
jgi:hypothetical protein